MFQRCLWALGTAILLSPCHGSLRASSLTLAEARRRAFERSGELLAAGSDVEAALAAARAARAVPNPTLSISTAKIPTDGTPASTALGNGLLDRSYDSLVSLSELFEIGGKRASRAGSADASLEAARQRLEDARRRVDAGITKLYAAALVAKENARLVRLSAASLARSAEIASARFAAGEISAAERTQVEIAAGRFRADVANADAQAVQQLLALEIAIGESRVDPDLALEDPLASLSSAARESARQAGAVEDESALDRRPDLLAALANVARAESDLRFQKALRVPDPTLQAQYERQPPDQRNTFGAGVSLSLPLFNRNAPGIRTAEVALEVARRDARLLASKARAEIAGARAAYDAAETRRLLLDELVVKAGAVRDTVSFAYEKGGASLLELLESERSLGDLRQADAQAAADLVAAAADLLSALTLPTGEKP